MLAAVSMKFMRAHRANRSGKTALPHALGASFMAEFYVFPGAQFGASLTAVFKNSSIGTSPPDTSVKRLAKAKDGSLRRAKMLRKCHSEQSAATASSPTVSPLRDAQVSNGCVGLSDMVPDIPTRNGESQGQKFLLGMEEFSAPLLTSDMAGTDEDDEPTIYLGEWLRMFEIGVTEAAKIAGCSQPYLSNIIANRRTNVNNKYLLKLSDALGVNINDFYRRLPSKSQLNALKSLSPKAQATILAREQKKA